MNNENVNISLQQVKIFLKAVELRNFTQVANFFNYTPSMVSKTISALEEELQIRLFIRQPHELTPTPAAKFLAHEWRYFIASFNTSVKNARAYQDSMYSRISLGFVDSSDKVDVLIADVIRGFTKDHPDIKIDVEKHDMHRSAELLNASMLDIIITDKIEVPYLDEHNLKWEKVLDTHVAVYVPKQNPLFEKTEITVKDIKDQPFMMLDPIMHPTYHDWMVKTCRKYGFLPTVAETHRTVRSMKFALHLSSSIFIGDSINADWKSDTLKQFILPEKSFTLIAWKNELIPELLEFKDYLKAGYPDKL